MRVSLQGACQFKYKLQQEPNRQVAQQAEAACRGTSRGWLPPNVPVHKWGLGGGGIRLKHVAVAPTGKRQLSSLKRKHKQGCCRLASSLGVGCHKETPVSIGEYTQCPKKDKVPDVEIACQEGNCRMPMTTAGAGA